MEDIMMNDYYARYKAKISFTVDEEHPDIGYMNDWSAEKVYTFEDTYQFNDEYSNDYMTEYIKHDLMLIAGGGYNTKHIHNVKFNIKKV